MQPDTKLAKRGGAGRGQGRKSLSGDGSSGVLRLRVPPDIKAGCDQMGPDWTREVLRAALAAAGIQKS